MPRAALTFGFVVKNEVKRTAERHDDTPNIGGVKVPGCIGLRKVFVQVYDQKSGYKNYTAYSDKPLQASAFKYRDRPSQLFIHFGQGKHRQAHQ